MAKNIIDVWDVRTFDSELLDFLAAQTGLIRNYLDTDHRIFLRHDINEDGTRSILRPENRFASDFYDLEEAVGRMMSQRTIRAFHYTRLTENEAMVLRQEGIHLSTPLSLLRRISEVVAAGGLSGATAELLYARSPFQSDQLEARLGKFWMTSHPVVVTDSGVEPLLKRWGGEVASMWIRDKAVCAKLETLGKPRIIEVAAPLRVTNQSYQAGKAITATFARSRGSIPSKQAFDLYTKQPLEPAAVLQVHTEGDPSFTEMGVNYPPDYVDVDIGRWKELTGEED